MSGNPLPDLPPEQYEALKADIAARGVLVPVVLDEDGEVIDGHHRKRAADELGIDYPREIHAGLSDDERQEMAVVLNLRRRHLTREQRRALVAGLRGRGWSTRRIADTTGVAQTTVRRYISGEPFGSPGARSVGRDGKSYPARRPAAITAKSAREVERARTVLREADGALADEFRAGDLSPDRAYMRLQKAQRAAEVEQRAADLGDCPPPDGRYRTVVLDPPWPVNVLPRDDRPGQHLQYATMTVEDIRALPVPDLLDPDGAHLYLWVTHRFLPAGLDLLEAWGCRYECQLTWVKPNGFTPFGTWRYTSEHVLFARAGRGLPLSRAGLPLDFAAPTAGHSVKPGEFYELVRAASPGPRLEMFARRANDGFTAWGNEAQEAA